MVSHRPTTTEGNAYIRRAIKIESGAKSALDPHAPVVVKPYIADDLPSFDLTVGNVTTVAPQPYLLGQDRYSPRPPPMVGTSSRTKGRRPARLAPLLRCLPAPGFGDWAECNGRSGNGRRLCSSCVDVLQPARFRPGLATPGSFALTPHNGMLADLRRDYEAMSGMVFGPIPNVDEVVAAIAEFEHRLNI